MKILKKTSSLLLTLFVSFTMLAQEVDFIPGQLLIKLKDSAKAQKNSLSTQMKATTLKSYPKLGFELWEVEQANGKQTTLELIEQFKNHPNVEFVEPNYIVKADDGVEPNDPNFAQLWGLHNIGQNNGTKDADIDAPEAYCIPISTVDIVVGIIDTGIDYTHEDLAENIWQNLGEDADGDGKVLIKSGDTWIFDPDDENGIDDDGNGYVDDFVGWDFAYDDNDPMDLDSHGTHCAGTVGAVMNNNVGITGVAPNVKLAALKFLKDGDPSSISDAIDALYYAITMDIPISNNSWGGGGFSEAMYEALQNAEANNHLFIASAGNNKRNNDAILKYPASYDNDNIIAVAGTNRFDDLYDIGFHGTNYGATSVDIGAPGQEIYSCMPGNNYDFKSGTSMAAPHISGVCAFVWGANPANNYSNIKNALMNSVDHLPALNGKCVSNGRVNLNNALAVMGAPDNPCDNVIDPPSCNRLADSLALIALYNATNGPNWTNTWNTNQSMDNWHGVTLTDGRVTCLDLDAAHNCGWSSGIGNNLNGNIPPEIGNLCELTVLNLQNNLIGSNIPNEIGELRKLEFLFLGGNQLSGNLPTTLGNLTKLRGIWIEGMNLSGPIPKELGNLQYLEQLHLWSNNLTGNIPAELGNPLNLFILDLRNNNLTGSIPNELGKLFNLKKLRFSNNPLSGQLPYEIGNLNQLEWLEIFNNGLSGCYSNNLEQLCDQLVPPLDDNGSISEGNNFGASWEDFCNTGAGSCGPLSSQVWPGDFDNNGMVERSDLLYWGAAHNETGTTRANASTNWVGQDCLDWSNHVNGVNGKYQDGNGDGIINNVDKNVLTQNLGQNHNFTVSNLSNSDYLVELIPNGFINTNSNTNFEYVLKVTNNGNPASAHGVCASIFFGSLNVNNVSLNLNNSSLQPIEYLGNFEAATNTYEICLTRIDKTNKPMNNVARIVVQVVDEPDTGSSFALNVNSGKVMSANGTLELTGSSTTVDTYGSIITPNSTSLFASVTHANCSTGGIITINVPGSPGNYGFKWNTGETTQQIINLSPGIYSVLVCDNDGLCSNINAEVQGNFIPVYDAQGNLLPCNTFSCPTLIDFGSYVPNGTQQAERAIHTKANLQNGYNVELKAGNLIRMTSGFSTRDSQSYKVQIQDCQ